MSKVDLGLGVVFGAGLFTFLGCTSAEWGNIRDDFIGTVPAAVGDALIAGGGAVSWPLVAGAAIAGTLGVVYRSAIRDFGASSGKIAASVVRSILIFLIPLTKSK